MKISKQATLFATAIAIFGVLAAGCGKDDSMRDVRTDAQRRQAQQQAIQNNPHIPEANKAAIIQRMQQGGGAKKPSK